MADQYDKTNTFALFINKDKDDEKHADRTGYVNIDGKEYWLNGWNRNNDVIGGSVKEKGDWVKPETRNKFTPDAPVSDEEMEEPINLSDIPF